MKMHKQNVDAAKLPNSWFALACASAFFALVMAIMAGAAWASPSSGVDEFPEVNDVGVQVFDEQSDADDSVQTAQKNRNSKEAEAEVAEIEPEAYSECAFSKAERSVTLGDIVAVGILPEAADEDSADEERAKWHAEWKALVESAGVDLSSDGGWLLLEAEDGSEIDYGSIVGIVSSDPSIFELFGGYPVLESTDKNQALHWWYGLLGEAKNAGKAKISIMCESPEGSLYELDSCTVTVRETTSKADAGKRESDGMRSIDPEEQSGQEGTGNVKGGGLGTLAVQSDGDGSSEESSSTSGADADSSTESASSETSDASTSSLSSDSSSADASGLSSGNETASSADYPKEMASTAEGSKLVANLYANDSASEEALKKLDTGKGLSLVVEVADKYGDDAETALSAVAKTGNLVIADRLVVKVVDVASSQDVAVSDMDLVVRIALDDTLKALDASSVQVWYIGADGKTEKKEAMIDGGYLLFATEHLSDYAVLGTKASPTNNTATTGTNAGNANTASGTTGSSSVSGLPATGDSLVYLAIVLAFVAGFSMSSALNARKRLQDESFDWGKLPPSQG